MKYEKVKGFDIGALGIIVGVLVVVFSVVWAFMISSHDSESGEGINWVG